MCHGHPRRGTEMYIASQWSLCSGDMPKVASCGTALVNAGRAEDWIRVASERNIVMNQIIVDNASPRDKGIELDLQVYLYTALP